MDDPQAALPTDGLDGARGGPPRRRLLLVVAVAETLSLAVLLVNLLSATHSAALAAAVGPVHGGLYLTGVLLTWTAPFRRLVKLAAIVPVAGAWIAVLLPEHAGRTSTRRREAPRWGRGSPGPG